MALFITGLSLLALALFGAPLFTIFAVIALLAFRSAGIESSAVIIELYRLTSQPVLLAIPLFTFAGYLLAESKTPQRLIRLTGALIGWMPGGLAIVALVSCALFTSFTGASGVTIIALSGLLYPVMLQNRYPENFTLGLLTSSGNLGLLFPPSLPLILYGLVSQTSIDELFLAGLLPGILMIILLSLYSAYFIIRKTPQHTRVKFVGREAWQAVSGAAWEIPLPLIVLGGIYGGFFTATEAAAITAFYVFIIEVFVYRDISIRKDLRRLIRDSMMLVGGILVILSAALGLANYMVDAEIPMQLFEAVKDIITSRYTFLIALNIFLLIIGALMDIFSAILVVVPIIIPVAANFGIDPVHLGIIFLTNLGIGYSTPPIGMNLFIASFRFEKSIWTLTRATFPFLIILLITLILLTFIPEISLGLLRFFQT
jgi:tripartite ATP-independent transporter DctM subunit